MRRPAAGTPDGGTRVGGAPGPDVPRRARLAVRELERLPVVGPAEIDAFLADREFPLVEGTSVTFVWRGPADEVNLRHWVYGLPSSQPFRRLRDSDLWVLTMELPEGSRVEYKLEIVRGADRHWIEDPRNDRRARDPFGANSVCHCAGYVEPEWTRHDPAARPGRIEERVFHSDAWGGPRPVGIYLPARFRPSRRYPLLVVHDGPDYVRYAGLKTVLDNLIDRGEIPAMIVALTGSANRLEEYADHPAQARFLVEELVPALERELPLEGRPAARGLVGASFGAVATLAAAVRHPGFFGRLMLQSGSFAFSDIGGHDRGPAFDPVAGFVNAYRDDPIRVADRVFVSCGVYESLVYENRSLVPVLRGTGMDVRWVEARDGHNWENWRDRLREGLSWLFPGPLWMVYE